MRHTEPLWTEPPHYLFKWEQWVNDLLAQAESAHADEDRAKLKRIWKGGLPGRAVTPKDPWFDS